MSTLLQRRGFILGEALSHQENTDITHDWQSGAPIFLKAQCLTDLANFQTHLAQSNKLYQSALQGAMCETLLDQTPYIERLAPRFESLGSSINEGDEQEIETVLFDALENEIMTAEDLWMKASWLSFYDEDASLRFRFSFGVDLHEDVAADEHRQHYAALLTNAIFPESLIITQNDDLLAKLYNSLDCSSINFVERIIYFNAPQGGAYLHHDRERGHAGVVYAQLSGKTFWLALTREQLVDNVISYTRACEQASAWPSNFSPAMQAEILALASNPKHVADELESFCHTSLIHLINETATFIQQLIRNGHSYTLEPGDILLLPQETPDKCCWHSVFTLGEATGEALSFAIRKGE